MEPSSPTPPAARPRGRAHPLTGLLLALAACAPAAAPPPDLILLITIDTLRTDHLGAYGSTLGATPRLDALAAESLVFTRAHAPCSFTLPSVTALMTGLHPPEVGVWHNTHRLPDDVPRLAEALQRQGWGTGAVVGNYYLRAATGLNRGFDVFDDEFTAVEPNRPILERGATATTDAALALFEQLSAGGKPVFLWVHYQDPHGPYTPPEALRERFLEALAVDGGRELPALTGNLDPGGIPPYQVVGDRRDVAFYKAGYAAEVHHMDAELGRLLDGLAASPRWPGAAVVVAADHGEALGEDDFWFAHGQSLADHLIRVPLMVHRPGGPAGRRDDVAALFDVYPTVLGLAGLKPPKGRARDLLAEGAAGGSTTLYLDTLGGSNDRQQGLVAEGYRLVVKPTDGPDRLQLFRVGEEIDVYTTRQDVARRLEQRFYELRNSLEQREPMTAEILSLEDRERLHALGYLAPDPGG